MSSPTTAKSTEREHGSQSSDNHGKTTIADNVVQKIVSMATREVAGVYQLGTGAARAVGALRERVPGSGGVSRTQGVSVEVGEKQTAIDLDVVVEYGVSITDLVRGIRRNVISSVERMTGLEVTEVNVSVDDVHLPGDQQQEEQQEARVQ